MPAWLASLVSALWPFLAAGLLAGIVVGFLVPRGPQRGQR